MLCRRFLGRKIQRPTAALDVEFDFITADGALVVLLDFIPTETARYGEGNAIAFDFAVGDLNRSATAGIQGTGQLCAFLLQNIGLGLHIAAASRDLGGPLTSDVGRISCDREYAQKST